MHLRVALFELASAYRLDPGALRRLRQLAGLDREPEAVQRWLPRVAAFLAAALGGFGIILWVAANWESIGRAGRFVLLQGTVLAMCASALWRPALRAPCALLALLAIGALLAFFGQTYQTGADAWQLFALWAVLALPLCLGVRSDVLWSPWTVVAMSAIPLWIHAHAGYRWAVRPDDLLVHAIGWSVAVALTLLLSPPAARRTGAGPWSLRTAVTLAVALLAVSGLAGLQHETVAPHYLLALLMLACAAAVLAQRAAFDVFALSAVALGLIALLTGGLVRLLFEGRHIDLIVNLLILGLAVAVMLAVSVSVIVRLTRRVQGGAP